MKVLNSNQLFLYIAWLVSTVATLGSLYFSEIRGFVPCELCWYQRILMYPLALILGIGTFQNDIQLKSSYFLWHLLDGAFPFIII